MSYEVQLDISSESTHDEVLQFATEHGCTAKLLIEDGPAGGNPLYLFQSEKFDYLDELVSQILGTNTDTEFSKTSIYEN